MNLEHLPEELRDKLEDLETQYGSASGKIAMAMDLITDAEISAGQLNVYCRHGLDPRRAHPDLERVQLLIKVVRTLLRESFQERRGTS